MPFSKKIGWKAGRLLLWNKRDAQVIKIPYLGTDMSKIKSPPSRYFYPLGLKDPPLGGVRPRGKIPNLEIPYDFGNRPTLKLPRFVKS